MSNRTLTELTGGSGDTTTSNTYTWVPADSYVDTIIEASVDYGKLSGVITAIDYDMQRCQGDQIQVRYIRARTAQGPMCEGGADSHYEGEICCLSTTSSTVGTQAVQIEKFGDMDVIPGFTDFEVCGDLRGKILNEMAKGLAKKRDAEVWSDISACHPHHTEFTDNVWAASPNVNTSCCTYGYNLYDMIVSAQKFMQGRALEPDYVVLHPTVSKYLYFSNANGSYPVLNSLVTYDKASGRVTGINGMKVIESGNAATGVVTSKATLAVVLDSRIACAEAWGKKPTFESNRVAYCDRTEEIVWMYWGSHNISGTTMTGTVEGVSHICNP